MSTPEMRCWISKSTLLWSVGVKLSIHLYFPSSGRHRVAQWAKKESEYSGDGAIIYKKMRRVIMNNTSTSARTSRIS